LPDQREIRRIKEGWPSGTHDLEQINIRLSSLRERKGVREGRLFAWRRANRHDD
jgi:hypothetical protein